MGEFYKVIEHTADIGIEVVAPDIETLFVNAGLALFDLMFGLDSIEGSVEKHLHVSAGDTTELLVAWLNELLYVYAVEKMVFCRFVTPRLCDGQFRARGVGELFDPKKHRHHFEIKAATYHHLSILESGNGWKVRIILDI